MPLKSQAERRWLWANKPELAREFEAHTPKNAKLPERVGKMTAIEGIPLIGKCDDGKIQLIGKAGERAGHKYLSRRANGKGGWVYNYAPEGEHHVSAERLHEPTKKAEFEIAVRGAKEGEPALRDKRTSALHFGDFVVHREKGYGGMQYYVTDKKSGTSVASPFHRGEAMALAHHMAQGTHADSSEWGGSLARAKDLMRHAGAFRHEIAHPDATTHHRVTADGKADLDRWAEKKPATPLIGKLEPAPARGAGPAYPYGRQTLPDYQEIYNVTPSKKDQKQERKELIVRRRASAARNAGRFGFHGEPPEPVLRNERGAFNAIEPGKSGQLRTKPTVLPALIFKPRVDQARSRLVQRKRVP